FLHRELKLLINSLVPSRMQLSAFLRFGCKKIIEKDDLLHRKSLIFLCSRTPCPEGQGFNVRDITLKTSNYSNPNACTKRIYRLRHIFSH
ncbi:MAG: hypothetical protein AABY02_03170, partial [Nanoarchaeota archaeon]